MRIKANRFGLGFLAIAAAALVGATAGDASAVVPPPPGVEIESVRLSGSACPSEDSFDAFLSEDRRSFIVVYKQFNVSAGPGIPLPESSKDCSIILKLDVPPGYTYAVASLVAAGHTELEEDVVGRLRANVRFPGTRSARTEIRIPGPTRPGGQDFEIPQQLDILTYSRCGFEAPMLIGVNATVDNTEDRRRAGLLTVSDTSGVFETKFNLVFERCR